MSKWQRASSAKPGQPFIPDRKDLNKMNGPAREVAARRAGKTGNKAAKKAGK